MDAKDTSLELRTSSSLCRHIVQLHPTAKHSTPQCEKAEHNLGQKKVQLPIDMWNALVNDKERENVHLEDTMPANDDPNSRDPAKTATRHDVQQNYITKSAVKHTLPKNECLGTNHPVILQPKLTLPNDNPTVHSIQSSEPQHKAHLPQDELNQPNNFPSNIIAQIHNQPKRKVFPVDSNIQNPKKQKISPSLSTLDLSGQNPIPTSNTSTHTSPNRPTSRVNKKKYSLKSQARAKNQSSEAAVLMEAEKRKPQQHPQESYGQLVAHARVPTRNVSAWIGTRWSDRTPLDRLNHKPTFLQPFFSFQWPRCTK
ncbi:hypothetical protein FCV25MIE_20921 [Fagus crenata]